MASSRAALNFGVVLFAQVYLGGLALGQTEQTPPPAPPAAQPGAPAGSTEVAAATGKRTAEEEIVVTGSRVPRKDLTTPAPVTVISSEQIVSSGKVSIGDYLQSIPEQGNALNTQVNNGGSGATRIDLRGLGALRTLILVNGRRMIYTGTGNNSGTGVDINTIPSGAVERIEVLKDGASAVYGSDAISGVVNVITKKKYDGTTATIYYGGSPHGSDNTLSGKSVWDAETYNADVTTGTSGDLGSILFNAGYFEQHPIFAGDRIFSQYQLVYNYVDTGFGPAGSVTKIGSSRQPAGRIIGRSAGGGNPTWTSLINTFPTATSFIYDPSFAGNVAGWRPFVATAAKGTAPRGDLYNFQPVNYDLLPQKRVSLFSSGNIKLGDQVRGFFEASLVNRDTNLQLAPEPLIIGTGGAALIISGANAYNPFGRDFTQYTKRLTEFGPRQQFQGVTTYRVVTGIDGTAAQLVNWDLAFSYARTQYDVTNRGNLNTARLQNAVGPSYTDANGKLQCGSGPVPTAAGPGPRYPGCVPVDLFHGENAINQDMINYLVFTGVGRIRNELVGVQANGSMEIPYKLLSDRSPGLAVGGEFRYESGNDIPDPVTAAGESTGNNRQETKGGFNVWEGYAELSIPIVSGMTGVENLEASAAVRVFKYSTFGTDATYKFGGRWTIVRDFTVRGTYSTAFRAPSITELYLGVSDNFPNVHDPCATFVGLTAQQQADCRAQGVPQGGTGQAGETQTRVSQGGNANLKPETAKTFTVGFVVEPRWVKALSFAADYYWINIDQAIQPVGATFIVQKCYPGPGQGTQDQSFCNLIDRDATGAITRIHDVNVNIGGTKTAGIDASLRYTLPTEYGRFGLGIDGTWLQYYNVYQPDGTIVKGRGNFDVGQLGNGIGGVYPSFKALGSLVWGYMGFGAGITERYVGGFRECAFSDGTSSGGACYVNPDQYRPIQAWWSTDINLSYDFRITGVGKTTVAAGLRNAFDARPPTIYAAFTPQSDPTGYDFIGRFIYGRIAQSFLAKASRGLSSPRGASISRRPFF
jgi:outer membrane receptor protein involved in Fe transport